MNKKLVKVCKMALVFQCGYATAQIVLSDRYARRAKKVQPLLSSLCANVIHKAASEGMTIEELKVYCDEQLNFYNLVVKEEVK